MLSPGLGAASHQGRLLLRPMPIFTCVTSSWLSCWTTFCQDAAAIAPVTCRLGCRMGVAATMRRITSWSSWDDVSALASCRPSPSLLFKLLELLVQAACRHRTQHFIGGSQARQGANWAVPSKLHRTAPAEVTTGHLPYAVIKRALHNYINGEGSSYSSGDTLRPDTHERTAASQQVMTVRKVAEMIGREAVIEPSTSSSACSRPVIFALHQGDTCDQIPNSVGSLAVDRSKHAPLVMHFQHTSGLCHTTTKQNQYRHVHQILGQG